MISYINERIITNNTASVQDATSVATSYTHTYLMSSSNYVLPNSSIFGTIELFLGPWGNIKILGELGPPAKNLKPIHQPHFPSDQPEVETIYRHQVIGCTWLSSTRS
jgi:hypothetical protein